MNGLVKQSDTGQQIAKDMPSALPAEHVTMLGISIADILQAGGTWPPVGTIPRTATGTVCPSAPSVICSTKDGNGISVDDLTSMSPAALRRLCERHNASERMNWKNSGKCYSVTVPSDNVKWIASLPSLSDRQKQKLIHDLRNKRRRMLHAANSSTTQRAKVNQQLYILTGHKAYLGGAHP
jgi:hypothetical protein